METVKFNSKTCQRSLALMIEVGTTIKGEMVRSAQGMVLASLGLEIYGLGHHHGPGRYTGLLHSPVRGTFSPHLALCFPAQCPPNHLTKGVPSFPLPIANG